MDTLQKDLNPAPAAPSVVVESEYKGPMVQTSRKFATIDLGEPYGELWLNTTLDGVLCQQEFLYQVQQNPKLVGIPAGQPLGDEHQALVMVWALTQAAREEDEDRFKSLTPRKLARLLDMRQFVAMMHEINALMGNLPGSEPSDPKN